MSDFDDTVPSSSAPVLGKPPLPTKKHKRSVTFAEEVVANDTAAAASTTTAAEGVKGVASHDKARAASETKHDDDVEDDDTEAWLKKLRALHETGEAAPLTAQAYNDAQTASLLESLFKGPPGC